MPYLVLIMSLIQPIYAFPFAAYQMVKSSSYIYIFCIALAFSIIALNLIPDPGLDLYRHYQHIDSLRGITFSEVLMNYNPGYLLFDIYSWILLKIGLPKQMLTATAVFIAYTLVLSIYKDFKNNYLSQGSNLEVGVIFFAFFIQVSPIGITSGIRNTLANLIVFYITYKLINNKNIVLFLIGSIIAILTHPAAFIPVIIVLLGYFFNKLIYKYSKLMIILAVILMVFSSYLRPIIEYLDSLASNLPFYKSGTYTDLDSHWGAGFEQYASTKGIIADYINKLPTYFSLLYLSIIKPQENNKLYTILCLSILYLSIFSSYATLFGRINNLYINLLCLFISIQVAKNHNKLQTYSLITFLFLCLLGYMVQLYSFSEFWLTSIKSFYKFLPFYMIGI